MARKERKTTIHMEPFVVQKYETWIPDQKSPKTEKALVEITASCRLYTLCTDVYFLVWLNGEVVPGPWSGDGIHFDSRFTPKIQTSAETFNPATLKIEAYRVPDTVATARLIGTLTGQLTAEGLVVESLDNVTAQFTNVVKKPSQYSPERTRAAQQAAKGGQ